MAHFRTILLLSIDNLRFDCIDYQPDKRDLTKHGVLDLLRTPMLDSIANESLCYTNCVSVSSYTTSSHASVFTGLYPPRHGVRGFFDRRLSSHVTTMAEIFKINGYRTVFATDVPELFVPLGLTRGFDHLIVRNDPALFRLMERHGSEKLFVFVHFFDVHEPFLFSECPPASNYNADYFEMVYDLYRILNLEVTERTPHSLWRNIWQRVNRESHLLFRPYVTGVSKFDQGRFSTFIDTLKRSGMWEDALTVIFSDHGEGRCSLTSPSIFSHGGELFDNVIRVILMIKAGGGLAGKTDDSLVSLPDIFPTIVNLAGLSGVPAYCLDGVPVSSGTTRDFCYGEVWAALWSWPLLDDQEGNILIPFPVKTGNQWLLFQRFARTKASKLMVVGKQEDLIKKDFSSFSDEMFVRHLYRTVLARFEDNEGLALHTALLKKGDWSRDLLVTRFLESGEHNAMPRFYMYDLVRDPHEDRPLVRTDDVFPCDEGDHLAEAIGKLDDQAVATEKIFPVGTGTDHDRVRNAEQDQDGVMQRLRDLGYI